MRIYEGLMDKRDGILIVLAKFNTLVQRMIKQSQIYMSLKINLKTEHEDYLCKKTMLVLFRIIALLGGLSYILLLGLATPIKYLSGDPQYVKLLGMPHGVLFILYIIFAFWLKPDLNLNRKEFIWVLLASIIPFGTFYVDFKYFKTARQ